MRVSTNETNQTRFVHAKMKPLKSMTFSRALLEFDIQAYFENSICHAQL